MNIGDVDFDSFPASGSINGCGSISDPTQAICYELKTSPGQGNRSTAGVGLKRSCGFDRTNSVMALKSLVNIAL